MRKSIDPRDILRRLTAEHGSQAAAARYLGVGGSYYGDVLSGRRPVSDQMLARLGLRRVVVRAPADTAGA